MAAPSLLVPESSPADITTKRKHADGDPESDHTSQKKARLASTPHQHPAAAAAQPGPEAVANPVQPTSSLAVSPPDPLLGELATRYEVLALSVVSSTSIARRVDRILAHLGRFHPSDMSVLPGVVLLRARAGEAAKLVSVAELVRRRVAEAEHKWWQYNRLYEAPAGGEGGRAARNHNHQNHRSGRQHAAACAAEMQPSVIEETDLMGMDNDDDDDDFEFMQLPLERAAAPQKTRNQPQLGIFLSRVPVPELAAMDNVTVQSNADEIEYQCKKRAGLI